MQINLKSNKKSINKKWLLYTSVIMFLCVLVKLTVYPGMPTLSRTDLSTVVVQKGDIDVYLPVYGQYISEYERLLTSPNEGMVTEVLLRAGADVNAETVIAKMSNPDLQQNLHEAQSKLERMKSKFLSFEFSKQNEQLAFQSELADMNSQMQTTKLDVDVNTRLVAQGITGAIELERSTLAYEQIKKRLEFANFRYQKLLEMHKLQLQQERILLTQQEQDVERIKNKINELNIVAGIDGTLQKLNIEVGQRLVKGSKIGKVGSKEKLIAQINIPQRIASSVISGATVKIINQQSEIQGHITQMRSIVEEGFIIADVAITDVLPKSIKPAQPLNAQLFITHKKDALFVEQKPGLIPLSQRNLFTQINNASLLEKTKINFGELTNNYLLITSGVKQNDILITSDMSQWQSYNQLALDSSKL